MSEYVSKSGELSPGTGGGGDHLLRAGAGGESVRRPRHPLLGCGLADGAVLPRDHHPARPEPAAAGDGGHGRGHPAAAQNGRAGTVAAVPEALCAAGGGAGAAAAAGAGQRVYMGFCRQRQRHRAHGGDIAGAGALRRAGGDAGRGAGSGRPAQPGAAAAAGRGVSGSERPGLHRPRAGGGAHPPAPSVPGQRRAERGGRQGRPDHKDRGAGRRYLRAGGRHGAGRAGAAGRRGGFAARLPLYARPRAHPGADVVLLDGARAAGRVRKDRRGGRRHPRGGGYRAAENKIIRRG